ncbi:calmodulin-regulated spectrin-associated protein 1a isoform X2 [Electrophorus electricus]|uniref:calmodulin-regulated spectrin-associated protein 1a isoform X2 n=1 Tax=Electrophorus electricus TaxID=8005 RepID=UPI0015CFE284|nr:calmodulin-regulated spectrin-associated protein 1a isoform X2 [Electrophorus electricus]
MNADAPAGGGDSAPRRADSAEGVLDIVPLELYDSARAKIDANLRWLFAKAYGEEHVPEDLRDPFYTDQYRVEHLKPPVLELLLTAELYCRVCGLLSLGEQAAGLASHRCVLQALARRGVCVREADGTPVTHDDLGCAPIKMSSHIPLIDALMLACTVEMMSVERVVASVKRFSTFCASKELPFNMEDTMLFWINKVILKTREITEKELKLKQHLMDSPCHQKSPSKWYWKLVPVRYRRDQLSGRSPLHLPLVEDLMKDVCDGVALLTIVHYYCPEHLRLEDVCLKEVPSLSDSVYNIRLLREFSTEYLNRCLYLHTEDLLYAPPVLKHNVMVYVAELFWWFEVVRPDFVKPKDLQESDDVRTSVQTKSSRPYVPISNITKHSFLSPSPSADSMVPRPTYDPLTRYYLHLVPSPVAKVSPSHSPSHQLLPLRQRQQKATQVEESAEFRNRSSSLSRMDEHGPGSRLAWLERRQRPLSQMETDWERLCGDSVSLARSISKDSLASNVIPVTPQHQRTDGQPLRRRPCANDSDDQEEEPAAVLGPGGGAGSREPRPESFFLEPLQPAVLRPNKEKTWDVSKREESGEGQGPRWRGGITPTAHAAASGPGSGFFLHGGGQADGATDSEEEEDVEDSEFAQAPRRRGGAPGEEESAKLLEDGWGRERQDKEDGSGRSSPCLSTPSQASSASAGAGRVTSFAERRLHRGGSSCSSQATTPDGSESSASGGRGGTASELLRLRLQLEEKRHAIEAQKAAMETAAERRLGRLGKAAFLDVLAAAKGRGHAWPRPPERDAAPGGWKGSAKDDARAAALKARAEVPPEGDNRVAEDHEAWEGGAGGELDLSECSRSIELLNEAIGGIQRQMLQLSAQQDLLMKQTARPLPDEAPPARQPGLRPSVQFVEIATATRRPPKLSSAGGPRSKPADLGLGKESHGSRTGQKVNAPTPSADPRPSSRGEDEGEGGAKEGGDRTTGRGATRNAASRLRGSGSRRADGPEGPKPEPLVEDPPPSKGNDPAQCEENRAKAQLIEVDLSGLASPQHSEAEQKSGLGFFFKDEQKAADELAKKRAAFLLKQQKKAEGARLRKQQLEAESELKRDEARRKAEEERLRKEEEKARKELIKQEYLRRKQQELLEEQGVAKPRPCHRKPRPKSLQRGESGSSTSVSLCAAPSGSSLSLASAATEADSVTSGGGSQRGESVESFPMLSRNASRNMERDWDNGSTASSITSVAEYSGPRLFKEPSAKSNKALIQNAITHCCLAGKVNEAQKNAILEEIERCECNHLMILFRDGGCQFRALYAYAADSEEMAKLAGTGPRAVTRKMIDKLFKYSSDRKMFSVIPAKTVSASVDAVTIHSHLWQVRRLGSSRRK